MKIIIAIARLSAILSMLVMGSVNAKATIRVGYLPIADHLPVVVAHANDNGNNRHIDVVPRKFKNWGHITGAFRAGAIDAAFILSPLAMDMYNKKNDLQAILLAHRDGSAITVKVGGNIKSALDLKGKAIAIPDNLSTHKALLSHYLIGAGLSLSDVKTLVISPLNMEKALKKGAIDAFIVAEPFGAKAQISGVGEILVLTNNIEKNHLDCILIVRKSFIENNSDGVQEWVDSLIRAGKFIDADKMNNQSTEVANIASKQKYMGHKPTALKNGLQMPIDRISFSDLNPNVDDFQRIIDMSKKAKMLQSVNLDGFINATFYQNSSAK
jgi:NitT/TauT family transport system substrate-binding protein